MMRARGEWKLETGKGELETWNSEACIKCVARPPFLRGEIDDDCSIPPRIESFCRFAACQMDRRRAVRDTHQASEATMWAWRPLATWRLPHRRKRAVLLSGWGAVYSGFGHVSTHGTRPSTNGTQNNTLRHSEGLGDESLKCGLAEEWPQISANIWSARSASSRRIVSRMRSRRIWR